MPNSAILDDRVTGPRLFWILQLAGWTAFGALMFVWGLWYFTPRDAMVEKAALIACGLTLTLLLRTIFRHARRRAWPVWIVAPVVGVTSLAGSVVWLEGQYILLQASYGGFDSVRIIADPRSFPFGSLLYYTFVLIVWSLLYFGVHHWLELATARRRAERAEQRAHDARIQALQSQLEPHFLFNTLNAISTLVAEGHNAAAGRMLTRLSDFLRLTLETSVTPEVSVAEELQFIQQYLDIQYARFGDRLCVTIDVQPETLPAMVPALVMQPLVENAVVHGVLTREQGGTVMISIARSDSILRLSVSDDGHGSRGPTSGTGGLGLSNTSARLTELYGNRSRLSIGRSNLGGVAATIEIPFRTATTH